MKDCVYVLAGSVSEGSCEHEVALGWERGEALRWVFSIEPMLIGAVEVELA